MKKLFVGGLSYQTTEQGLADAFAKAGNVLSAIIITDRITHRSKGFGFVEMENEADAEKAAKLKEYDKFAVLNIDKTIL